MSELSLQALYRYPVKSLRGEEFASLAVDARGPVFDRRWMIVDADNRFLTQRQQSRMALIDARVDAAGALHLAAPGMAALAVADDLDERVVVQVWNDSVDALAGDAGADAWLGRFLGQPCRLVRMPDDTRRGVDPAYANAADQVGFADGFPFLLISQASLDRLNARLDRPLPMLRFRPNLVVAGCAAHAEDDWRRIRIGDLVFRVAKPCARCVIPGVDIASGERGREPLQTLRGYRSRDNKIYFGQNLLHDGSGMLEVGMPVEILA